MELDIDIDKDQLRKVMLPIFQRAIDITNELIQRNNLSGDKLDALILVGGPTHSPILREMLEEQIKKPDTSADPMTAVASGAALYASTVDLPEEIIEGGRETGKIQLDVGYSATTVEKEVRVTIKTLPNKTDGTIPEEIFAELEKIDKTVEWSSGKIEINSKGEIIEAKLDEGTNNFHIILYDDKGNRLEAQPNNFTIICGISDGGGAAILNHSIGR
ncbi:MAG: Hsp70 family protein [Bacteroidales bacterium]|nr:Hsp70 family protein [Bacteroidales bacterium]